MTAMQYSTRFFCPTCKREGRNQMLFLDESISLLRCERHKSYMKQCNCRVKDMIIFEMYPESEEESMQMIDNLEDTNEEQARIDQEEKLEYEYAMAMNEAMGDDFVEGFEFEEGA